MSTADMSVIFISLCSLVMLARCHVCRFCGCSSLLSRWQWSVLLEIRSGCHTITHVTGTLAFMVSTTLAFSLN